MRVRACNFDLAIDAQIDMRNAFLLYLIGAKRRLGFDITGGGAFLTDVPEFQWGKVNLLEARLSLMDYLGINTDDKATELPVARESVEWAEAYLERNGFDKVKVVGIHPGASVREKLWQSEKFAGVTDYFRSSGYQPVIIEGPSDRETVGAIVSLCKVPPPRLKTELKNAVAFMSLCRLVLCLDSAALHIAGAVGTPAVAIYGPKWPELTKPFNDNIEVVWDENVDCRPCEYGHCKKKNFTCMDAISVEAVISKCQEMLWRA